jgi:hypothetical protein
LNELKYAGHANRTNPRAKSWKARFVDALASVSRGSADPVPEEVRFAKFPVE